MIPIPQFDNKLDTYVLKSEYDKLKAQNAKMLAVCKATYAMFEHANAQHLSTYHEVIMDSLKSAIADVESDE